MVKASKSVGSVVALTEDYVALLERPDLRNVLLEVVDTRYGNGVYAFRVAPIIAHGVDWNLAVWVFEDDLKPGRVI